VIEDVEERVRQRAYQIWEREGRPEGREQDHWDLARQEIAIEDNIGDTLLPNPSSGPDDTVIHPEPVEPLLAAETLAEDTGGPTEQSEEQPLPKKTRARRAAAATDTETTTTKAPAISRAKSKAKSKD
jgi:hypothetical protein